MRTSTHLSKLSCIAFQKFFWMNLQAISKPEKGCDTVFLIFFKPYDRCVKYKTFQEQMRTKLYLIKKGGLTFLI